MRYHIRDAEGHELICPNLGNLHTLYERSFVSDADWVRSENSEQWIPVAQMHALRGTREQKRDPLKMGMLFLGVVILVIATAIGFGCRAPAPSSFSPNAANWRGGCFFEGALGKVINGSPSGDLLLMGTPCGTGSTQGNGALLTYNRFDAVGGTGDVALISTGSNASLHQVALKGGAGLIFPGQLGVKFNSSRDRGLTVTEVDFVTGKLITFGLSGQTKPIADGVRVLNFDFIDAERVVFLGNYDSATRTGDLFLWNGTAPQLLASGLGRFDFLLYRLSPGLDQVAYLTDYVEGSGGQLWILQLPASSSGASATPVAVASGVLTLQFSEEGHLLYTQRSTLADETTLSALDRGAVPSRLLADRVHIWRIKGSVLLWTAARDIVSGQADLWRAQVNGGSPELLSSTAAPDVVVLERNAQGFAGAFIDEFNPTSRTGVLKAFINDSPPIELTPDASSVNDPIIDPTLQKIAYTRGAHDARAPNNPAPQPSSAAELWVAPLAGGSPALVGTDVASFGITWNSQGNALAFLEEFDPAGSRGRLRIFLTDSSSEGLSLEGVGSGGFGFSPDGKFGYGLRSWNDALGLGTLSVATLSTEIRPGSTAAATWTDVDEQVSSAPSLWQNERFLYTVRSGARGGVWLGQVRP